MLKSLSLSVAVAIIVLTGSQGRATAQTSSVQQPANPPKSSLATNDHWLASDIYKAAVYDADNNKIGTIDDLVLDSNGQIKTAVIGVGGFLGIGQKDVAIPFNELKVAPHDGREQLTLARTKQQLKDAPAYDKTLRE